MGTAAPHIRFAGLRRRVVLGHEVPVAESVRARLLGLARLPADSAPAGLLLPACRSVHTFGMRFPIDVVFLDAAGCEIRRIREVPPRRLVCEPAAVSVLELRPGQISPTRAA